MRFCSITLLTLMCATFLGGCHTTSRIRVPDGIYAPDPKIPRFAGEVITVSGSKYDWSYFADALPGPPDKSGRIKFFSDHILLKGLGWNEKRIPSVIEGTPVLWTEEGYAEWKKSGLGIGLLYLKKVRANEPNKAPEPTPVSVMPPAEPGVMPAPVVAHL